MKCLMSKAVPPSRRRRARKSGSDTKAESILGAGSSSAPPSNGDAEDNASAPEPGQTPERFGTIADPRWAKLL
jgi:hypothetical protein